MDPRLYQNEAVRRVLDYAIEHPTGRLLLVIPPRGGKTLVGALLVLTMALRHGLRALWLVHREELLDEAVAHLIEVGIHPASIGVIKAGRSSDSSAKIQVASEQTLDRRRALPVAHLVVTDEAHRDTAPRRRRLRKAYPKAFLLGLTGTPKPPPQRDLGEDYDTLLVVVQPSELIHDGFLAVPTIFAPDRAAVPNLRGCRLTMGDYRPDDLEPLLVRDGLLDEQVGEWARLAEGRTTLAYPVTIGHSRALVARFQAHGVPAVHVDSTTPREERRNTLLAIRARKVPIVCSVDLFSEGTNLPEVKCVLMVRPTRSLRLNIQQGMRCATPWRDVKPRLLDVVGNCYEHGSPFEDRIWSLVNAESGRPVDPARAVLKRCVACGAMVASGMRACTNCLAEFPSPVPMIPDVPLHLKAVEPEPEEIDEERVRLLVYAKERGFKNPTAWTDQVLARKHGLAA